MPGEHVPDLGLEVAGRVRTGFGWAHRGTAFAQHVGDGRHHLDPQGGPGLAVRVAGDLYEVLAHIDPGNARQHEQRLGERGVRQVFAVPREAPAAAVGQPRLRQELERIGIGRAFGEDQHRGCRPSCG